MLRPSVVELDEDGMSSNQPAEQDPFVTLLYDNRSILYSDPKFCITDGPTPGENAKQIPATRLVSSDRECFFKASTEDR